MPPSSLWAESHRGAIGSIFFCWSDDREHERALLKWGEKKCLRPVDIADYSNLKKSMPVIYHLIRAERPERAAHDNVDYLVGLYLSLEAFIKGSDFDDGFCGRGAH